MLKTKIELEGIEFEENLPDIRKQGHINDGRRLYREDGSDQRRPEDFARGARSEPRRSRPVPQDPFFEKPYEPSLPPEAAPSWEAAAARPGVRTISSNIKTKRKVAALFQAA
jgi:hypothetical protein